MRCTRSLVRRALRRRRREDRDDRRSCRSDSGRRRDSGNAGVGLEMLGRARRSSASPAELSTTTCSGPLKPGTEAGGQQVVGLARGHLLRVGARVGDAEVHREGRDRQHDQDGSRDDRHRPRATLDSSADHLCQRGWACSPSCDLARASGAAPGCAAGGGSSGEPDHEAVEEVARAGTGSPAAATGNETSPRDHVSCFRTCRSCA